MGTIETQPRSVSQTEQWEKCGYQFYLKRVERVTPRPAAWSHQGTAFHSAAEAVERSGRTMTEEEAVQLFSDQYSVLVNKSMREEPNLGRWMTAMKKPAGDDINDRYRMGQEQVRRYVQWSQANQPSFVTVKNSKGEEKVGLELYFKVELGGVVVRGYIDQLPLEPDKSTRVRDLKTGSTKSRFQLETYKVAAEKQWDLKVYKGDWYQGKKHGLTRPLDLSEVTEEQVAARYVAMDQGVKAGRFEANPGFDCGFCDVSHACSFSRAR
ncbi:RecB family exonuclease [Streptomyces mutomycini]|uniref:RecB family exonuclease n=1 Tax=Streptomyces mutomycini TaxID=284036 RepID=UPI0033FAC6B4